MSEHQTLWDLYVNLWKPASQLVADYEAAGIGVDVALARYKLAKSEEKQQQLREQLKDAFKADINWASPKQLLALLFDSLKLPAPPVEGTAKVLKRARGPNTSTAALVWLSQHCPEPYIPGLQALVQLKKEAKIGAFYASLLKYVDQSSRVHCQLGFTTETGRLASRNPNLQNQPAEVRDVFVGRPGHRLVVLDFGALEWVILAHIVYKLFGDRSLIEELEQGVNPHSATAIRMGLAKGEAEHVKERHRAAYEAAKALNYSVNYGKTAMGLSVQLSISEAKARKYLDLFFKARPGIKSFHTSIISFARRTGYVKSLLGRRRYLDYENLGKRAERQAMNVIQNCATDLVVCAMVKCGHGLGRQILQVHDELIWEVPEEKAEKHLAEMKHRMVNCLDGIKDFYAPLAVSGGIAQSWKEAK